jgi:hypothetical protein
MADIQDTYPAAMARGMVGQKARTNAPFDGDRIKIGAAGLKAGDAFKLDANGDAVPLGVSTEAVAVLGALMYEPALINDPATGVLGEYAVGDWVEYMVEGYIFGTAGADLSKDQDVLFDPSTHKWTNAGAPVAAQKKVMSAAEDAPSDSLTVIKIGARV